MNSSCAIITLSKIYFSNGDTTLHFSLQNQYSVYREAGRMGHSRKKLELTGQSFGKLTVIAPAENVDGRTAWLCRCQCGREQVVKTCRLRQRSYDQLRERSLWTVFSYLC